MSRSIVRSKINAKYTSGGGTGSGGTVTSVGLTMPTAFTVTNSPIVTAGSITVAGAGTSSQYIDGTGALVTFPAFPTIAVSDEGILKTSAVTSFNFTGSGVTVTNVGTAVTVNIPNAGTVTSVGLSMPAAFTVTNSPVIGSGTLTVTGAGSATQYVKGDGSLGTYIVEASYDDVHIPTNDSLFTFNQSDYVSSNNLQNSNIGISANMHLAINAY